MSFIKLVVHSKIFYNSIYKKKTLKNWQWSCKQELWLSGRTRSEESIPPSISVMEWSAACSGWLKTSSFCPLSRTSDNINRSKWTVVLPSGSPWRTANCLGHFFCHATDASPRRGQGSGGLTRAFRQQCPACVRLPTRGLKTSLWILTESKVGRGLVPVSSLQHLF